MSLVPEIKRVPWQYKLNFKAEINLLLKSDDNFSQFIHQPQQLLPTSDYSQTLLSYMNSSEHYSQHFARIQPTTSGIMGHDQIPQTLTDLLSQPNIQSSPHNLASTQLPLTNILIFY
ncbi:hypothetical protein QTP88_022849 [Uroleucon formosanum]